MALSSRRGWDDPLDQALFANAIDRPTLDALMLAIEEALPDFRRYLRAKARLLGLPVLAAYDIFAPVGEPAPWSFDTSRAFIVDRFAVYSPRLGALAERAFAERWIDAGPRPGKDGGAFSMPVGGDESRVFLNFLPVYDWMSALAHELGHSYHCAITVAEGPHHLAGAAGDDRLADDLPHDAGRDGQHDLRGDRTAGRARRIRPGTGGLDPRRLAAGPFAECLRHAADVPRRARDLRGPPAT